jgi:NAD(P)-dependent dehydrogenase (short-subunit alcohol dehydrogenase family)
MQETAITTPFGFDSTASEVIRGVDLSGKRAIVTGASSGIGTETARALARAGAEVTLAVRDLAAGFRTAAILIELTGNVSIDVARLDLADRESVAGFAEDWEGPLDILVNNAGVMALPQRRLTREGWETQFATNHLGHFALANDLHWALAEAGDARIVSVSSRAHLRTPVVFDDLHFDDRMYDPDLAYGQSKTANVLFAVEATRRWADDGITANAVHPGAILATHLARHMDPRTVAQLVTSGMYAFKTIEQGAATSVLAAASPWLDGVGGRYLQDCNEAPVIDPSEFDDGGVGVAEYALDPDEAERLWEVSEELVGVAALASFA